MLWILRGKTVKFIPHKDCCSSFLVSNSSKSLFPWPSPSEPCTIRAWFLFFFSQPFCCAILVMGYNKLLSALGYFRRIPCIIPRLGSVILIELVCNRIILTTFCKLHGCSSVKASDGSSSREDLSSQLFRRNEQIRKLEVKLSGTCLDACKIWLLGR